MCLTLISYVSLEPSVPKEKEDYKKRIVDSEALRAALTDRDLLQRIFDADPNEEKFKVSSME